MRPAASGCCWRAVLEAGSARAPDLQGTRPGRIPPAQPAGPERMQTRGGAGTPEPAMPRREGPGAAAAAGRGRYPPPHPPLPGPGVGEATGRGAAALPPSAADA